MYQLRQYRVPGMQRVDRGSDTERLYTEESRRGSVMERIGEEWLKLAAKFGWHPSPLNKREHLYTHAMPQVLFDTLESFDTNASLLAALAFVEYHRRRDPERVAEAEAYTRG